MTAKGILREIGSFIMMLVIVVGVTHIITTYVASPLVVDGSSMYNTLEEGERLWMFKLNDIERFDVVVFPAPDDPEKLYVKRIIGLPGDSLAYQDDQLYLNGQVLNEPYLEPVSSEALGDFTYDFTLEESAGVTYIPEETYFVMGDNRQNSLDSRRFGLIDASTVVGEADMIYWPFSEIKTLSKWELNDTGTAIVER